MIATIPINSKMAVNNHPTLDMYQKKDEAQLAMALARCSGTIVVTHKLV